MKKYILLLGFIVGVLQAQPQSFVASMSPSRNAQNVRPSSNIVIAFSADINPGTLTSSTVKVYGSLSGPHALKSLSYTGATRSVAIDPSVDFSAGDVVTVVLTQGVQNILGDPMPAPFSSQFTTASKVGSGMLIQTGIPGTGNQPWAAATVDFDHDGAFDFLVLNRTSKTVSLLRNYGSGNFLQTSSSPVGTSPSSFVAADLNGDDTADCAVANEGSNTVTLLFMDGKGNFSHTTSFAAAGAPSAIIAADCDGDGDMDLIVANRSSNSVSVYKNNGSGTFTLFSTTIVGAGPSALAAGDFNSDGIMDVAVACESPNTLTVLLNNGSGTFSASAPVTVGAGPVSLAAGDFDNDGSMDLAVACKTAGTISVMRNDGTGKFYLAASLTAVASPLSVAAGDMDGDGNCDIVGLGSGLTVFHNQGYLQFSALASVSAGTSPHGLVLADLDGDGDLDCATPNSASSSLSLLTNRPAVSVSVYPPLLDFGVSRSGVSRQLPVSIHNDGVLVPLKIMSVSSSNPAVFSCDAPTGSIAPLDSVSMSVTFKAADVKNYSDSLMLVTNDPVKPIIKVFLKAVGGLVVLSTVPGSAGMVADVQPASTVSFNGMLDGASLRGSTVKLFGEMSGLHAAQITLNNIDRKATITPVQKFLAGEQVTAVLTDSVTAASSSIRLLDGYEWKFSVLPAGGSEFYSVNGSYTTGQSPYAVAPGDFNGDGFADLAVINSGDNTVSVFINDTHGALVAQAVYTLGTLPQALCVGDFNEDGAPDIAVVNTFGNSVSILLNKNTGDGSFFPAVVAASTGVEPRAIAVGDLNNDGHLDLVTANTKDNTVSIFTNDGSAHFTLWKTIPVGASPRALAVVDINNDGASDIAVMNRQAGSITVLVNARGIFNASVFAAGNAPTAMTACDINRDGFVDLVTANSGSKDLSILLNNGSGGFASAYSVPMYNVPTALCAGEMNGDGIMDLVVAQYSSASEINTVQVLINTGNNGFGRGDSIVVNSPVGVAAFDLNNRGVLHLAVPNLLTNTMTVINPAAAQTPALISPLQETRSLKPPITLQWQNTARTVVYHVQVSDSATGSIIVNDSTITLRQYLAGTLGYSTTYRWRVRAKNDVGWGEFSAWWNFSTCIAPPQPPLLIAPSAGAGEQETAPVFVWHAPATAESYRIQAALDSLFTSSVFDLTAHDTLWQSSALKIHTPYFWRVKASNFGGESEWSETRSFVTLLPLPEQVSLDVPLNHAYFNSSAVSFSWHAAQWEVKKYWFEIAADSLFMFRIVDSAVADTTWQMQKLSGSQRYFWKVRAFNEKGWGPFSSIFTLSLGSTSVADNGRIPDHFALEQNFPNPFNPSTQIQFSIAAACPVRLIMYDILGREIERLVNDRLAPGVYTVHWNARDLPSGIYLYRLSAGTFNATKKLSLQK